MNITLNGTQILALISIAIWLWLAAKARVIEEQEGLIGVMCGEFLYFLGMIVLACLWIGYWIGVWLN